MTMRWNKVLVIPEKWLVVFSLILLLGLISGCHTPADEPDRTSTPVTSSAPENPYPEMNLYSLEKTDTLHYQYKDILFKLDETGTLYRKNGNRYDVFCKTDVEKSSAVAPENENNDIPSKTLAILDAYGRKKRFPLVGPNASNAICTYKNFDYFELSIINGAGSGEYWGGDHSGIYIGIHQSTGEIQEFEDIRAGYCKEKDNWVYYLDLINANQDRAKDFPVKAGDIAGMGYLCRMRPDTSQKQILSHDVAVNGFEISNDHLYYVSYPDSQITVISMDGKKTDSTNWDSVFDKPFYRCPYTLKIHGNYLVFQEFCYDYEDDYIVVRDDLSAAKKISGLEDYPHYDVICRDEHSILFSFYRDKTHPDNSLLYLVSDIKIE